MQVYSAQANIHAYKTKILKTENFFKRLEKVS